MWMSIDEGIRSRIKTNIVNSARSRMIIYLLLLLLVVLVAFLIVSGDSMLMSIPFLIILMIAVAFGLLAVFYIYYAAIREDSKIVDETPYMVVGKVITKISNNKVIVKIPGEKVNFTIDCDREFYKNVHSDSRILVLAVSKRNENEMIGFDPSTYDTDGIL